MNLKNANQRHLHGDYTAPSDLERFNPGGYDNILFICNEWLDSNHYDLSDGETTFQEIEEAVARHGDVAMGIRSVGGREDKRGGISLNPPKESGWRRKDLEQVVVLTTYV